MLWDKLVYTADVDNHNNYNTEFMARQNILSSVLSYEKNSIFFNLKDCIEDKSSLRVSFNHKPLCRFDDLKPGVSPEVWSKDLLRLINDEEPRLSDVTIKYLGRLPSHHFSWVFIIYGKIVGKEQGWHSWVTVHEQSILLHNTNPYDPSNSNHYYN